jgi:hypothetical protein
MTPARQDRLLRDPGEACKAQANGLGWDESHGSQNGNFVAPSAGKLASGRWTRILATNVLEFHGRGLRGNPLIFSLC